MTNFEYFIWLLKENEEFVDAINKIDIDYVPMIANEVVFGGFDDFTEDWEEFADE